MRFLSIFVFSVVIGCGSRAEAPKETKFATPTPPKRVLVTIDDLPVAMRTIHTAEQRSEIATKLCEILRAHEVPAIGFVNMVNAKADSESLELWRTCVTLGNHTWSHPSLGKVGIDQYLADVKKGHDAVRELIGSDATVYFRYPYLYEGFDRMERNKVRALLSELESRNIPVTIETSDWYHARGYVKSLNSGDDAAAERFVGSWWYDMTESTMTAEWYADELFSRQPPQVLLIHANLLNARYLDHYLTWLRERDYEFVTVEDVLADPAYQVVPDSVSPSGDTHWQYLWRDRKEIPFSPTQ